MVCERIFRKDSAEARKIAEDIIHNAQRTLRKKDYTFDPKLIGSAVYGTLMLDENGIYDLDYQLYLQKTSEEDPQKIKNDFFEAFKNASPNDKHENSTSVITIKHVNKGKIIFSFDFAVIVDKSKKSYILRRKNDRYVWEELSTRHLKTYEKYHKLSPEMKKELVEKYILPEKCKEKKKNKDERKPSSQIFVEQVNNYYKNKYGTN